MKPTNKQAEAVLPSLLPELSDYIAQFLLQDDVVDYISFRAVCREWRSSTASPRGFDSCFRPRRWILLPDGDAYLYTASRRRFLNLSTGRSLLLHLPELGSHYLMSDSDGLLVLVDKVTHIVRLFNPFTRHLADLPPSPPYEGTIHAEFQLAFSLMLPYFTSSISSCSCPTVVFFTPGSNTAYYAKPGDSSWVYLEIDDGYCDAMLYFKGRFYLANPYDGIRTIELDQNLTTPLIPPLPHHNSFDSYYLAEYNAEMLVVYHKTHHGSTILPPMDQTFSVFKVDLESNRLVPLNIVRDLSVFLAWCGRSLVLSSKSLPSVKGNSIYFCTDSHRDPVILYNFDGGEPESISVDTALYECNRRIRSSIRPFTLAHHLITYCRALNWSFGLMYHEFLNFPIGYLLGCEMVDDFKRNYGLF